MSGVRLRRAVRLYRQHWTAIGAAGQSVARQEPVKRAIAIQTRVVYKGPRLLSVGYLMRNPVYVAGGKEVFARAVNVELATGRALTAAEIFRPGTLSGAGLADLSRRIPPARNTPDCTYRRLTDLRSAPGGPFAWASVALARDHLEVVIPAGEECQEFNFYKTLTVPFSKAADLLRPEATALARATAPPS